MTNARDYGLQKAINALLVLSLEELSLREILRRSLDIILPLPWLSLESKGSISLVRVEDDTLEMLASRGLPADLLLLCARIPFGTCLCGRAAATREIVFADCVDDRHELRNEGIAPHGHYCVPILFRGRVLGVINLYLKAGHRTTPDEIAFLNAIANTLAGVIHRSTIEEEQERLIDRLQDAVTVVGLSQREWQETFDGITDMIAVLAPDGFLLKANKAYAAFFHRHPRELVDVQCLTLSPGQERSVGCPLPLALAERRQLTEELQDPESGRVFRVTTFPCTGSGETINRIIHIARDITEERENELRLIMSERLASLGQMASGIAHEINNPLAAISGCTEGLQRRVREGKFDPDFFLSYLAIIAEEIARCKGITTGMLSFVRQTTHATKAVRLDELLSRTVDLVGVQGRLKEVRVVKRFAANLPDAAGSEGELRQVFLAIIGNALDAMGERGTLSLETGANQLSVFVRIGDTGAGIRPENLGKIYEPFFTTKSDQGGTGLGLSIARKIVLNHHGRIDVVSGPGQGTTFTVQLPFSSPSSSSSV